MRRASPTLIARFVLDEDGKPEIVRGSTGSGLKHYTIELGALGAPTDAESVTYVLHDTYYDPVREIKRKTEEDQFLERITSYGDYLVRLGVSGRSGDSDRTLLTEALRRGHKDDLHSNAAINQAIAELREK